MICRTSTSTVLAWLRPVQVTVVPPAATLLPLVRALDVRLQRAVWAVPSVAAGAQKTCAEMVLETESDGVA
jgi:hypothetical protein